MFFIKKLLYFYIFKFPLLKVSVLAVLCLSIFSCGESDSEYSYHFPALSSGQLIDLKKKSETMEGFFMTTDLSDFDEAWASRGTYLYSCVRFLNNEGINNKLKKSAIPLLVQVSNKKDEPMAEAVMLLHPKTDGVFYHIERRYFNFVSAPIQIGQKKYLIHDIKFNKKGKITSISFVEESVDLKELKTLLVEYGEEIYSDYNSYAGAENNGSDNPFIEAQNFAKLFSSNCNSWSFINYQNNDTVPDYLKVEYTNQASLDSTASDVTPDDQKPKDEHTVSFNLETPSPDAENALQNGSHSTVEKDLKEYIIPEDAPHVPVEKIEKTEKKS